MNTFNIDIVTPEENLWSGTVQSLIAPMTDGYLGVLANHAPLLGALGDGELSLNVSDDETIKLDIKGGFLEVLDNNVSLLADAALWKN